MRGRKPQPTNVIMLKGNPGKRSLNKNEPKPRPIIPPCPRFLGSAGRRKWKELVEKLERLGLLTELDGDALAAYCFNYDIFSAAAKHIKDAGEELITYSPNGYPLIHPYLAIANKAVKNMYTFMVEFGFTPASRRRIEIKSAEEIDEVEQYLNEWRLPD